MTTKVEKNKKFHVFKCCTAGCSLLKASEGFFCNLDVLFLERPRDR
jgi:hypothetical protein